MPRSANTVPSVQITISTTLMNKLFLEALVGHGGYGKNAADAAERLVSERLRKLRRGNDDIAQNLNDVWRTEAQRTK